MRSRFPIIVAALLAAVTAGTACDPDPGPPCVEAYDHLIVLAKRPDRPGPRDRFLKACREAFDEGRHTCILAAKTPEEALDCRPRKVRPG